MLGRDGQATGRRAHARQDGRQCVWRQPRHRARVAKPGGLVGQRRKVGEGRPVDVAVPVEQRRQLKLVEDDDHHRRRRGHGDAVECRDVVRVRQQATRTRGEEKHRRYDERGRGQERGKQPGGGEPAIDAGRAGAAERGQPDQDAAGHAGQRLDDRERHRRGQAGDHPSRDAPTPARATGQAGETDGEQAGDRTAEAEAYHQGQ